jgi:hypothetical protein
VLLLGLRAAEVDDPARNAMRGEYKQPKQSHNTTWREYFRSHFLLSCCYLPGESFSKPPRSSRCFRPLNCQGRRGCCDDFRKFPRLNTRYSHIHGSEGL